MFREKREPTTRRKPINLLSLGPAHEQTPYGCALGHKVDQMKGCSHGAGRLRSLTPRDATALLGVYLLLIILVTIVAEHRTLRCLNVVSMLCRQVEFGMPYTQRRCGSANEPPIAHGISKISAERLGKLPAPVYAHPGPPHPSRAPLPAS